MRKWTWLIVCAGLFMLIAELWLAKSKASLPLILGITILPTIFFTLLTNLELRVIERKRLERSGTLIGSYMLFKGVRLLITIIAIAIYIYVSAPLRMMFIVNMLILFFLALAVTSICHLRAERKN